METAEGVDPKLHIKILEAYLKAVLALPIPSGGTVNDLFCKVDNKLYNLVNLSLDENFVFKFPPKDEHGQT